MKKQSDYKFLITICCIYEIIAFLTLYTHDICDLWLKPCGLQYIILCLIIPVIAILLWIWKADIFKKCKPYVVPTVITSVLFVPLIVYFLAKPTVLDFTNSDTFNNTINSVEQTCIKQETRKGALQDRNDIIRKCSSISLLTRGDIRDKKIIKRDFLLTVQKRTEQFKNYPNYAFFPCEKIASEELLICFNSNKCFCISQMVAYAIKKNQSLRYSN